MSCANRSSRKINMQNGKNSSQKGLYENISEYLSHIQRGEDILSLRAMENIIPTSPKETVWSHKNEKLMMLKGKQQNGGKIDDQKLYKRLISVLHQDVYQLVNQC